MAVVRLSDIIEIDVWASYGEVNSPELTAFLSSGVVARSAELDSYAEGPSKTGTLPFWTDLDAEEEPNYSNDDPSDKATPGSIDMADMSFRKAYLNKGWGSMDLVNEIIAQDPIAAIKRRTSTYWLRQLQRRVIAISRGVLAENIAVDGSDMVIDVSTQDGVNATAGNRFNTDAFVNAAFTMGDRVGGFVAIGVHSMIAAQMTKNDEIEFRPDSEGKLVIPYYKGLYVVIDDSMPVIAGTTSGYRYVSVLFGRGFIGMGVGTPRVPVEMERDATAGNGGGEETFWERKSWLLHPVGHDWVEGSLTEYSPTLANLADAAHWDRIYERKLVPAAFLITN